MAIDNQALFDESKCYTCLGVSEFEAIALAMLARVAVNGLLNPPTNPDIADASVFNDIIFTWTNPVVPGNNNEVWKSTNGGAFVLVSTVAGNVSSYHDPVPLNIAGQTFTYKVRTIYNGQPSQFTATRQVVHDIVKTGAADVTLSYPDLVMQISNGGFGLFFDSMGSLTSFSAPLLRRVDDQMNFSSDPQLVSVDLPELRTVGVTNADNFFFDDCSKLATLSLPKLTQTGNGGGNFHLRRCIKLTSFNLPLYQHCGGDFAFDQCTLLTSVTFPSLTAVDEAIDFNSGGMVSISLPALTFVGTGFVFNNCTALTSISAPVLADLQGDMVGNGSFNLPSLSFPALTQILGTIQISGCSGLTSISFPALTLVTGSIDHSNCTSLASVDWSSLGQIVNAYIGTNSALVSLSLPALTSMGGDIFMSVCFSLTTVSIPGVVFASPFNVDFSNCSITVGNSAAGTGIDGILRRLVVSGVVGDNIDLSMFANATPSAAGLADKATLNGTGNVCVTN